MVSAAEWIMLELELINMEYETFLSGIAVQRKKSKELVCMTSEQFEGG